MPKVSVLLSVYNGKEGIAQTLNSILGQTYTDYEVIIVNDGSTDNSINIAREMMPSAIIIDQENTGLAIALNNGLVQCKGEYIARIDCFDIAMPDAFASQVTAMDSISNLGAVGGHVILFGEDGQDIGLFKYPTDPAVALSNLLQIQPVISHSGAMIRKSKLLEAGSYDKFYNGREDFELWCRLSLISNIFNLNQVVIRVLSSKKGITYNAVSLAPLMELALLERVGKNQKGLHWRDDSARINYKEMIRAESSRISKGRIASRFYCKRAGVIFKSGERINALRQYCLALKSDPAYYRPWFGLLSLVLPISLYVRIVANLKSLTGKNIYN